MVETDEQLAGISEIRRSRYGVGKLIVLSLVLVY